MYRSTLLKTKDGLLTLKFRGFSFEAKKNDKKVIFSDKKVIYPKSNYETMDEKMLSYTISSENEYENSDENSQSQKSYIKFNN